MIPLGTGLFKTMYDTNMHNEVINKRNEEKMLNNKDIRNEEDNKGLKNHRIGYKDNQNIIEVKLKSSGRVIDNDEITSKLSFNLVDLIN